MTGSFSSEAQSKADSNFYDIRLHMVEIQMGNEPGNWLYVEQALGSAQDKPYRQRVYQVVEITLGIYESRVYEFENPLQYAGGWKDASKLNSLTFDKLILRDGCSITLKYEHELVGDININRFVGSTGATSCPSSLRGASYATSEVVITEDQLLSWDRGWDVNGKQVWGAETGGYIFVKTTE
ncbi:MAG: chromophore lyase CpcT/CpeT [Bacteroidetes bacterium]|nr:chromophore lyase CpcT/CpeT [Bacteroidota bacterium]